MKIIDYELACDISCMFEKNIFIYGAGMYGKKVSTVLSQMEIEIEGFCETKPVDEYTMGKKIISVKTLIENFDTRKVLVIIASERYYKEMIKALQTTENLMVCTYYALFISLYLNCEMEKITESLRNYIRVFKKVSLDSIVHNFLNSWWTAENFCNLLFQPSLVWLYQPGKVASVTIHQSNLSKTYHFHSLACAFNANNNIAETYRYILSEIKKRPIKIITGIREPISRDISAFFQGSDEKIWPLMSNGNVWLYLFSDFSKYESLNIDELKKRICILDKSLNDSFDFLCREIVENKADEFSWFDYEIKSLFGIDVYAYPFNKEKGYSVIEQGNIKILIYKLEKINQLEEIIGEFLAEPKFSLKNENQGGEKIYSYVYKKFKKEIKLNKQYFDYYYNDNSKLKHFYTESEINQFRNKWIANL